LRKIKLPVRFRYAFLQPSERTVVLAKLCIHLCQFDGQIFLFEGVDYQGPTTTDVHIYLNGTGLFPGMNIASFDVHLPFSLTESLNVGDHIDFAVGFGTDGNYLYDSTGLSGSITPLSQTSVPEPATLFLLVTGLAAMSLRAKRKSGPISA
jgi:hypothetical protein